MRTFCPGLNPPTQSSTSTHNRLRKKLLKALLAQIGVQFELTHNLTKLAKSVAKLDHRIPDLGIPLRKLTRFGVVYRYEFLPLSENPDRRLVIEAIRLLRAHIIARIATLSAGP